MRDKYDYLVIGSGPAGHVSAIKAAQLGLKVAVIEKDENSFGGVCLNEGCIPAKSLYHSAAVIDEIKRSSDLCGVEVKCGRIDIDKIVAKSREAALQLRKGLSFLFKKNGIDLLTGKARFLDGNTLEVDAPDSARSSVKGDNILIAAGSSARKLSTLAFDGEVVINSSHAIRLKAIPKNILIVGGGAIGVEFASFASALGSDVTIVEAEDRLLPTEDDEISRGLRALFKKRGINVLTSSKVGSVTVKNGKAEIVIPGKGPEGALVFEKVLVSVGRVPSTDGLGFEDIGLKKDGGGYIPVDRSMRTNIKNIFAAGDVVNTPMYAHVAYAEGELAAEAAAGKRTEPLDYENVPNVVFTGVQIASTGLTEKRAISKGLDFSVGKQFFKANGRAVANAETEGFIKVIADNKTHKLLGAHIIGHEAAELIHEFVVAKKAGLTVEDIAKTMHAHPTFSESAAGACGAVFGKPIHG